MPSLERPGRTSNHPSCGALITKGLGAWLLIPEIGTPVGVGKTATVLLRRSSGADMVFITAGHVVAYGTGAAPGSGSSGPRAGHSDRRRSHQNAFLFEGGKAR